MVHSDKTRAIIYQAAPGLLPSQMEKMVLVMGPHAVETVKVESMLFLARYEAVLKKCPGVQLACAFPSENA